MIVYQASKASFLQDVEKDNMEEIIQRKVKERLDISVGKNEFRSWDSSLNEMYIILKDENIPGDAGVAIEYRVPQTSKRIDFILTGEDASNKEQVMIIELKQWEESQLTEKDAIVITRFERGLAETSHPSYQAWAYAQLLRDFNQTVYEESIELNPCAYLHNYSPDNVITNDFYAEYTAKAPVFLKNEKEKLREFIKKYVKFGDKRNTIYRIENGKIKPSKSLADSLVKMLEGKQEFVMIDDQKIVFETALSLGMKSDVTKNVLIVEGGPGTGKSVVAVNLLVSFINRGLNARYVTKNAAPRNVYESMLTGLNKKSRYTNLFMSSGSFTQTAVNTFDALIIDEAHRLNEKSGLFSNQGENQIKEAIRASKLVVFFIDEDQKVTWKDVGTKEEIIKWSKLVGANVYTANGNKWLELASQFRCNGSDGYIAWLDNLLGIRETANTKFSEINYDFKVVDSPNELYDMIYTKNQINNKARLVAGYCWDWVSKKNPSLMDIVIPEHKFTMKWNLASDGNLWILKPESVKEIGCIHTCQGLELDYVGVIIGPDLIVRDNKIMIRPEKRAKTDASLKGYQTEYRYEPLAAFEKASKIIKNTYRTLLTRGMKGCYVYCTDKETAEYFKNMITNNNLTI